MTTRRSCRAKWSAEGRGRRNRMRRLSTTAFAAHRLAPSATGRAPLAQNSCYRKEARCQRSVRKRGRSWWGRWPGGIGGARGLRRGGSWTSSSRSPGTTATRHPRPERRFRNAAAPGGTPDPVRGGRDRGGGMLWEASDRVWGKRRKAFLPTLVSAFERHGQRGPVDARVRQQLMVVGDATIGRGVASTRTLAVHARSLVRPREESSEGKPHPRICGTRAEWLSYPINFCRRL